MPKTRKRALHNEGRRQARGRRKRDTSASPDQIALVLLARYCKAYQLFVKKLTDATEQGKVVNAHKVQLYSYLKERNIRIKGLND